MKRIMYAVGICVLLVIGKAILVEAHDAITLTIGG